jgi:hypothetical protein
MAKSIGKMNSLWRWMKPFLRGESARKQDIVLKAGQGQLDLTLLFLARTSSQGTVGRA